MGDRTGMGGRAIIVARSVTGAIERWQWAARGNQGKILRVARPRGMERRINGGKEPRLAGRLRKDRAKRRKNKEKRGNK